MALIQCRECKADISSDADECPKCGAPDPMRSEKEIENQKKIGKILGLVIGAAGLYWFFSI